MDKKSRKKLLAKAYQSRAEIYKLIGKNENAICDCTNAKRHSENTLNKCRIDLTMINVLIIGVRDFELAHKKLNKLRKIAEVLGNNEITSNVYNNFGLIDYFKGNLNTALKYYEKAIDLAKKENNRGRIAAGNVNLGSLFYKQGDYDTALKHFKQSLKIYEELNDKRYIASCIRNIGTVHMDIGNYTDAEKSFVFYRDLVRAIGFKQGEAQISSSLAILHNKMGNFEKSVKFAYDFLKISMEINDVIGIGNAYNLIGVYYKHIADYNNSLLYTEKATQYFKKAEYKRGHTIAQMNTALVYLERKKYEKAKNMFMDILKKFYELNDFTNIALVNINLGLCFSKMKKYDDALKHFKEASLLGEKYGNKKVYATSLIYMTAALSPKNIELAEKNLENILEYCQTHSLEYEISLIYYEYVKLYEKMPEKEQLLKKYQKLYNDLLKKIEKVM